MMVLVNIRPLMEPSHNEFQSVKNDTGATILIIDSNFDDRYKKRLQVQNRLRGQLIRFMSNSFLQLGKGSF